MTAPGTRIAVLTDVHADVIALGEALDRIAALGCQRVICAGDLVGMGPFPEETVTRLRERRVLCVAGNHDRWAIGRGEAHLAHAGDPDAEPWDARGFDLSEASLAFLAGLKGLERLEVEGVRLAVCHATPASDMEALDPTRVDAATVARVLRQAGADVLAVGHLHTTFTLSLAGGGLVVNPGALGREGEDSGVRPWLLAADGSREAPGPENVRGTFGVLELPARRFTVYRASDGAEVPVLRRTVGIVDRRGGC